MNKVSYNISNNILNIFTSHEINEILTKYHINKYYSLSQMHTDKILLVDNNYQNNTIGDAMITQNKNIALVIKTADCIPILIYDRAKNVLAVVHSGWRGVLNNITIKTIKEMQDKYNCLYKDIYIYLYPSIRMCHFEVKEDVYLEFTDKIKEINHYIKKQNNKYYIDLQGIVKNEINKLGITNIIDNNLCTYCHHDKFYSYRYNHTNKRNILLAMIKE